MIGGGITGLAAAYEIRDGADVTIFEASDRLGGKIFTSELDGVQIEAGPDSLLARDDEPERLLDVLGLTDDVVEPTDFGAWIATGAGLKRLPQGFVLGVPASPAAIWRSGLLSPAGILRAAADFVLPQTPVEEDVSVGHLVRARFGSEVAERIVAPLMSGVRSGAIDDMSLDMSAPQIAAVARKHRSLTMGLADLRRNTTPARFLGLKRGMSSLVEALRDQSGAEISLRSSVQTLRDDLTIDGRAFDGVIVATPPNVASTILGDEELGTIRFSAGNVVNLIYPPESVSVPPSGTGILIPPRDQRDLVACTWFSKKWPHLAPQDGRIVVRCVAKPDASIEGVVAELTRLVSVSADPIVSEVHHWNAALPEFRVGHRKRIGSVQARLASRPVRIAGAGYLATGINDCLAHGRASAREVLALARA